MRLTDDDITRLLETLSDREEFVLLETTKVTSEECRTLVFVDPVDRLICRDNDDPAFFFDCVERRLKEGYHLAGWIGYEFGYLLEDVLHHYVRPGRNGVVADLGVFPRPWIYNHLISGTIDKQKYPLPSPAKGKGRGSYGIRNIRLSQDREQYAEHLGRIKQYIAAGDTYQVNYTLKVLFDFLGSVEEFYLALRRNQSVSYGALIRGNEEYLLSFSPELFFRTRGSECIVRPMKGTGGRGRTTPEDRAAATALANDAKNRSENVMIVDLLRNDLGRICRPGSVNTLSLFDVEPYETLHQMTSTIRGELLPHISISALLKALFPSGSVTGAPKIRTMEIIRELETDMRGVYTGGIGYITPTGEAVFNVPIRTVAIKDGKGEMGIGSGIVYDSDPEKEWEECRLKAAFLTSPSPAFQLIETIPWVPREGFWLLEDHLARLGDSAAYFFFSFDDEKIRRALAGASMDFSNDFPMRVRLLLGKDGKIEITASPCGEPVREFPPLLKTEEELPVAVLADERTSSHSPFFFHKTTMRSLYDVKWRWAREKGYYDVLFRNERDEVTEGCITNVFVRKGELFLTPPVKCGLLAGVLRGYLLRNFPRAVREKILFADDIYDADAVYLGNSVRGLRQVLVKD